MKDIFLPPGIQASLHARFGKCPRVAIDGLAERIAALWLERNNAPEDELQAIDAKMEALTHNPVGPLRIIDGTPVPYSATVQARTVLCDGVIIEEYESIPAVECLDQIDDWMKKHRPNQKLLRTEGAHFFYGEPKLDEWDREMIADQERLGPDEFRRRLTQ